MAPPTNTRCDFYVYALFRETGIPFYIGKGQGPRWTQHERDARNGALGHKATLIRSMQKRGIAIAKIKIHEGLTADVALKYEIALIKAIGWGDDGVLLNRTDGGDDPPSGRGRKCSPETRAKLSAAKIGRKMSPKARAILLAANLGRIKTPEEIEKQSAHLRGRKQSPEHVAKSAKARSGAKRTPEARAKMAAAKIGKKHTPEHNAKIGAAQRGVKRPPEFGVVVSAAKRGKPNGLRGKKQTPEAIANRVASRAANSLAKSRMAITLMQTQS